MVILLQFSNVLVTVRYLARASFFSKCGDLHCMFMVSVSRTADAVTKSICQRLDDIQFLKGIFKIS